ncbi:hypothetical protein JL721_8231 [Aureococcus anophagefferens]|nr:hypothetical protein JL721_8231 [Aureococcus anophagefferens]
MWANLGSQQFHLAEQADDDPPQAVRVRGALGLALPDVAAAAARLQRLEARGACGPVEIHDADRFTATERYERLRAHCFTNQRFKHLDTCDTLAEARASRTFRFAFPALPNVEHETRALSHEQFLKRVHYAPP